MKAWTTGIAALLLLQTSIATSAAPKQITQQEIIRAILAESLDCERPDQIAITHLEYFDFNADGQEEAVVVASTCLTGTAGPDIHAVFTRTAAGDVVELPFNRAEGQPFFSSRKWNLPVFGNPNYTLAVENGLLVARWADSSGRKEPLVVRYKWNGSAFVMDSMKQEGPFKTSYDCTKAAKEVEQAICYSESVAALDLQLGRLYHEHLQALPPDQKNALQQEQRAWLAEREKKCVIYKGWVECLTDMYTKRIAALAQK